MIMPQQLHRNVHHSRSSLRRHKFLTYTWTNNSVVVPDRDAALHHG